MNNFALLFMSFVSIFLLNTKALAQSEDGINFQATIKLPSGEYPSSTGLTVKGYILSANNCILREEVFSNVSVNKGYISLVIGSGTPTGSDPGLSLVKVFEVGQGVGSLICFDSQGQIDPSKTSYNPKTDGTIRKFRLSMSIASLPLVADFKIRSVAHAFSADTLGGKSGTDFIQTSSTVTQNRLESFISAFVSAAGSSVQWDGSQFVAYTPVNSSSLSAVAASGSYSDLTNKPTLGLLASKSSVDLSGVDASGILAAGRFPALTGDVTTSEGSLNATISDNAITNAKISSSAAIAWSKISKSGATAGDISAIANAGGVPSVQQGLAANLPGASVAGRIYIASDSKKIYLDTGSAWVQLGVSTFSELTGSVPASSLGTGTANSSTFLRGDGTWSSVSGSGGGISACPTGWTMVGPAGKQTTYCIESTPRSNSTWHGASQFCALLVDSTLGNAHLCSFQELRKACLVVPALQVAGQFWSSDITGGGAGLTMGNPSESTCDPAADVNIYTALPYRCCLR